MTNEDEIFNLFLCRDELSKQIAKHIRNLVIAGVLRSGDRLPSERECACRFKVSRTIIREALKILEAWDLIQIKQGKGTFILPQSSEHEQ